jgi:hypothetical protein
MARRPEEGRSCGSPEVDPAGGEHAPGERVWEDVDGVHIDVRRLPPPRPLIAILRLIESDRHQGVVIAHLPRDPLHLYAELAERGWSATRLEGEGGEVRLRLDRLPA